MFNISIVDITLLLIIKFEKNRYKSIGNINYK